LLLSLSQNSSCLIQTPGSMAHKMPFHNHGRKGNHSRFQPAPGLTDSCHKRSVTPAGIAFQPDLGRQAPEQIRALASTDRRSFKDNPLHRKLFDHFLPDAAAKHAELPDPAKYPPLWKTLAASKRRHIPYIKKELRKSKLTPEITRCKVICQPTLFFKTSLVLEYDRAQKMTPLQSGELTCWAYFVRLSK